MSNRIIKESIYLSHTISQLSFDAAAFFFWLLPLPDDHGCCHLTPIVVKGRCFSLRDDVSIKDIEKWTAELEKNDLIRTWEEKNHLFAYFPTWKDHQRIRSQHHRKTPEPPSSVVNRCHLTSSDDNWRVHPNLNPNPNLNIATSPPNGGDVDAFFLNYWEEYPKRNNKKIGRKEAYNEWKKLSKEEQEKALEAIKMQVEHYNECKKTGQFVAEFPDAHRWLKNRRWEDDLGEPKKKQSPKQFRGEDGKIYDAAGRVIEDVF